MYPIEAAGNIGLMCTNNELFQLPFSSFVIKAIPRAGRYLRALCLLVILAMKNVAEAEVNVLIMEKTNPSSKPHITPASKVNCEHGKRKQANMMLVAM